MVSFEKNDLIFYCICNPAYSFDRNEAPDSIG